MKTPMILCVPGWKIFKMNLSTYVIPKEANFYPVINEKQTREKYQVWLSDFGVSPDFVWSANCHLWKQSLSNKKTSIFPLCYGRNKALILRDYVFYTRLFSSTLVCKWGLRDTVPPYWEAKVIPDQTKSICLLHWATSQLRLELVDKAVVLDFINWALSWLY